MTYQGNKNVLRSLIHSPSEAATAFLHNAQFLHENQNANNWGIPVVDQILLPERPGTLTVILGRPSDGKTSLMAYRAIREAKLILADDRRTGEAVVFVTNDDSVEEIEMFFAAALSRIKTEDIARGRASLDELAAHAVSRPKFPIYVIGHSLKRSQNVTGTVGAKLSPEVIFDAIEYLPELFPQAGIKAIPLVLLDYLQNVTMPGVHNRFEAIDEAARAIKALATRLGTRIIAGVQANRRVDDREIKLAETRDCDGAAGIERAANTIMSCWRPWRTEVKGQPPSKFTTLANGATTIPGAYITIPRETGIQYQLTDTLLLLQLIKQKGSQARALFPLFFNPAYLQLEALAKI